jgi:hypothetical protein
MRALVERVDPSGNPSETEAPAIEALEFLSTQCALLHRLVGDAPPGCGPASTHFDGMAVGLWAAALADRLEKLGLFELEDRARVIDVNATVLTSTAPAHVFSAVLARAACNRRLGRIDVEIRSYTAIAKDFRPPSWLDEINDLEEEGMSGENRALLELVAEALRGLTRAAPSEVPVGLLERIERALEADAREDPRHRERLFG